MSQIRDDVSLHTSSNEGYFEGFTPEDVIKAIEKGAQLQQIDDVDLSFISFDEDDGDQCSFQTIKRILTKSKTIRNDAYLLLQGKTIWGTMSQIRVTREGIKVKVDAHMRQQGSMS
jgi:hypothetical protein